MSQFLNVGEGESKVDDLLRHSADMLGAADLLGLPMIERPVNPSPLFRPTLGARSSNQQIGALIGQGVEQGIIGGADRSAQIGLLRSSDITFC